MTNVLMIVLAFVVLFLMSLVISHYARKEFMEEFQKIIDDDDYRRKFR